MKQVVFNVGGALSTYTEFVDLGKSTDFNPVTDFLLPLYKKRNSPKSARDQAKYHVDQLIISHPHNDHISSISNFWESFYPELLTCPNDNVGMEESHKINWELFESSSSIDTLKDMLGSRIPPLRATSDQNQFIYYLPPVDVEVSEELNLESYCNNISIATFLIVNSHRVFLPGDIQKLGMAEILKRNFYLRNKLKGGVDVLIAPHHGLRSSFSSEMFAEFKDGKTQRLNIVSEKVSAGDARVVDSRYSSADYCSGENNLGDMNTKCMQVKTSRGHVFVDYSDPHNPTFEIIPDVVELIKRFQ